MRRFPWGILLATTISLGCAKTSQMSKKSAPRPTTEGTARETVDLKMPKILLAMPESDVLDLGPVLVPADPNDSRDTQALLLWSPV